MPPGIDILYHWRITEDDGDVVETPEQTLSWFDDRYDWTPLEGPNVTVYTYDVDPAFHQEILDSAERTITSLSESYGAELEQRVRVWAYTDKDDLYGALAPNSEPWIAGAAYPGLHVIDGGAAAGGHRRGAAGRPARGQPPGAAPGDRQPLQQPAAVARRGTGDLLAGELAATASTPTRSSSPRTGEVPPLRTLNGTFPYDRDGATAAYALSLTAVMYILDTWGDEGMAKLLATFDEGVTYEDAVQQGLGISFDELDRQLAGRPHRRRAAARRGRGDPVRRRRRRLSLGDDRRGSRARRPGSIILGLVVLIAVDRRARLARSLPARRADDDEATADGVRLGRVAGGSGAARLAADEPATLSPRYRGLPA